MTLTLTITRPKSLAPGQKQSIHLDDGRLSLGRGSDSDWVFLDPERIVSKVHCIIEGDGNHFWIIDHSTNGVVVNDARSPLGTGNSHQLKQGDRLRIGGYEIEARISGVATAEEDKPSSEPYGFESESLFTDTKAPVDFSDNGPSVDISPDHQDQFGEDWPAKRQDLWQGRDNHLDKSDPFGGMAGVENIPPGKEPFIPPPGNVFIPEDWNKGLDNEEKPVGSLAEPVPMEQSEPDLPSASRPDVKSSDLTMERALATFFRAAGIDASIVEKDDPQRVLHEAGILLRLLVGGVVDLLEARRAFKASLRIEKTEFSASENNPLKFALSGEQALTMLLATGKRAYLPAEPALEEAFSDLKQHQLAVLAGMSGVWRDLLKRFDPETIQSSLANNLGLVDRLGSPKARYWDTFVERYRSVAEDADNEIDSLFKRKFARAYEHQVKKVQNERG